MEIFANAPFLFNAAGIIGVILILIGYFGVQTGKLKPDQLTFPILNFVGAALHLVSLYMFWNLASFIIEVFWIAISIYGIVKILKARKASTNAV
jgi:hypothetical protein